MLDDAIEEKLPHGQCPALVTRGARARVAPAEWAQSVADLLANGTLITIPGYAHMAHYSGRSPSRHGYARSLTRDCRRTHDSDASDQAATRGVNAPPVVRIADT